MMRTKIEHEKIGDRGAGACAGEEPARVAILGGHALSRAGIRSLLLASGAVAVVGEAADRAAAIALVERQQPEIVVLDLDMSDGNCVDLIARLSAASANTRIVALTCSCDRDLHRQAVRRGAVGLVHKDQPPEILVKAVQRVHAGEAWLDRSLTASVLSELSRGSNRSGQSPEAERIASLTAREREVIECVGAGLKNREIARRLFITDVTVRHHLTSIFAKLGVSHRLELIIYAYRHGLSSLPR